MVIVARRCKSGRIDAPSSEIWRWIQEVHPALAEVGRFIDWKSYRLGRLQSEMRTEFKKSAYER